MDDYKYQDNYEGYAPSDGYYRGNESNPEEDAQSDVTEGHDEEDEIYEGEYQGIPHPDDVKAKQAKMASSRADGLRGQADLLAERMEDEEQLAHQYETRRDTSVTPGMWHKVNGWGANVLAPHPWLEGGKTQDYDHSTEVAWGVGRG